MSRRRTTRALFVGALLLAPAVARAQAAGAAKPEEIDLSRILGAAPEVLARILEKGHTEFFRLVENVQLLDMDSEIDRFVGAPRDLNDSTEYKLSLLPYHVRYPIYRSLVEQMTRLDNVRAVRIHMVTPGSVRLIDLHIQPVDTLEALDGLGAGAEVQRSLLTHFTARETADLAVFLAAQQPLFPQDDAGWDDVKRRIARGAVPVALGALVTGAAFDAGALSHSTTLVSSGDRLRLGWYGGFRSLGVHMHPFVRTGLTFGAAGLLEAAAGVADQVRPAANQQDRSLELAVREGWLNQLVHPLGVDAFFEAAVSQSIQTQAGFTGDQTAARGGFFFKQQQAPILPDMVLRGSAEAESNLQGRLHATAALGLEHPRTGLATMVQVGHVAAPAGVPGGLDDDRVTAFVAGTSEPIAAVFAEEMQRKARQVEAEWEGLQGVEERRAEWEQRLVVGGAAATQTPEEAQRALRELAGIITERDERLGRVASAVSAYLDSRRRAYGILGWSRAPDDLHGPLSADVLVGARMRVLDRLNVLARDLEAATARLEPLRSRIGHLEAEVIAVGARDPSSPDLVARRASLVALRHDWDRETESMQRWLDAYDHLRVEARHIVDATGPRVKGERAWDTLAPPVRRRAAWLCACERP
jgi:hypothetical protein